MTTVNMRSVLPIRGPELTRKSSANFMMQFESGDWLPDTPGYLPLGGSLFLSNGPMYCKYYPKTKWTRWYLACKSDDGFIGYCSGIKLFQFKKPNGN